MSHFPYGGRHDSVVLRGIGGTNALFLQSITSASNIAVKPDPGSAYGTVTVWVANY